MRKITLTQGYVALVDDEDFDLVSKYKWRVDKQRYTNYALAHDINDNSKSIFMHRLILEPKKRSHEVDHKDGNGLNNTRENIHIVSRSVNNIRRRVIPGNKTGYRGISIHKRTGKYLAKIQCDGKQKYLGLFTNIADAVVAYEKAGRKLFGNKFLDSKLPPQQEN